MALWDMLGPEGTVGPNTWDMLVEHSSVDELTNDTYTHLENQVGTGVGYWILYDGLEVEMDCSDVEVEVDLDSVDIEIDTMEFDIEIDMSEYEVEVC